MNKTLFILLFIFLALSTFAQRSIQPFFGAAYGRENRIGFRGISLKATGNFNVFAHVDGVGTLSYFFSNNIAKWGAIENQGAFYRQLTTEMKAQYHSGEEPGTGFLVTGGIGIRFGKTYHFESGKLSGGHFTDPQYVTEQIRGNGLVAGIGYGFLLGERLRAKIEFTHYAIGTLNDMQTLGISFGW